jgi:hypothetical protein
VRAGVAGCLVAVLVAAGTAGCGWTQPGAGAMDDVTEQPYTFVGVTDQVETGPNYRAGPRPIALSPGSAGGGDFFVGPADIELHDGTQLTVPAGTPGGNHCEGLYDPASLDIRPGEHAEAWEEMPDYETPEDCVLIGSAGSDGQVAWFQILSQGARDTGLVHVGYIVEVAQETVLVAPSGYRFPIADTVAMRCDSGRYEDIADMVAERGGLQEALIDPRTGELVELNCISNE